MTWFGACSANSSDGFVQGGTGGANAQDGAAASAGALQDGPAVIDMPIIETCTPGCSNDFKSTLNCDGTQSPCGPDELCAAGSCKGACRAAQDNRSSVGCDYFPVMMTGAFKAANGCFAVFVANTWDGSAKVQIDYRGNALDSSTFGRIPTGTGGGLSYAPFDPDQGVAAGSVAIFFLAGPSDSAGSEPMPCPTNIQPALTSSVQVEGTGIGQAFHLSSSVPVVAYQVLPYGGGSAAVTGASLLLPTSAWDTNYIAVNAYPHSDTGGTATRPSLNLVAMQNDTEVTLLPNASVEGGPGIAPSPANSPLKIVLQRGQHAQITQDAELTGSPIESTKPIGLMAGHECLNVPPQAAYCDHAEQQIPPVRALGFEYVAVSYRQRSSMPENPPWRLIGGVDATELRFDPPSIHEPQTINLGQILAFDTPEPFVVRSQDKEHPFLVTHYMTGSSTVLDGYGDADFVRIVPPGQYLERYVFFTDPTYPETNLVVVRTKGSAGFADVTLDCAGALSGWQPVGSDGRFEYTRTDLVRHQFEPQGACSNGPHTMWSEAPFGLWVWGWGTPETNPSIFTANVSYGYPAGENVVPINEVYVPPVPK